MQSATGVNQAHFVFPDALLFEHDGLWFRSKTEIKIYEALKSRRLLFCPLPLTILGNVTRCEPDFLVFYHGRSGVLDIHGCHVHTPETAAQEHNRRRKFVELGTNEYEIYDAARCYSDPNGVVAEFLGILGKSKRF